MEYVYIITSKFVEAFANESENYSFSVYIHPSIAKASQHLYDRNLDDYLGYIYLEETLPKNIYALADLINLIDLAAPKGQLFVISLHSYENINILKKSIHCTNLNVQITPHWTEITDVYIGKLFSILLKNTRDIYKGFNLPDANTQFRVAPVSMPKEQQTLKYTNLFSTTILLMYQPVKLQRTLSETLQLDISLHKLKDLNSLAYNIRTMYVQAHFEKINEQVLFATLNKFSKDNLFINSSIFRFKNIMERREVH